MSKTKYIIIIIFFGARIKCFLSCPRWFFVLRARIFRLVVLRALLPCCGPRKLPSRHGPGFGLARVRAGADGKGKERRQRTRGLYRVQKIIYLSTFFSFRFVVFLVLVFWRTAPKCRSRGSRSPQFSHKAGGTYSGILPPPPFLGFR